MSFIWNAMLAFDHAECWVDEEADEPLEIAPPLAKVNEWLATFGAELKDLTYCSGGAGMDTHIYGAGFKRIDIEDFIDVVNKQDWKQPEDVQLFLRSEVASQWTVMTFSDEDEK